MSFYAIAKGKQPGIYYTWNECKENVGSYKYAIYKKFDTKEKAELFILDENTYKPKVKIIKVKPIKEKIIKEKIIKEKIIKEKPIKEKIIKVEDNIFEPEYYVYTDGACINNGKNNAVAGIGIYFGKNDSRNTSQKIIGKQSNNTAELGAILHLYSIIKNDIISCKKICIVSDSQYAIKCVTSYGKNCEQKEWKKDIPNKDLVKKTYELYKDKTNIQFLHILAHTYKMDIHSIGNRCADILANKSVGLV